MLLSPHPPGLAFLPSPGARTPTQTDVYPGCQGSPNTAEQRASSAVCAEGSARRKDRVAREEQYLNQSWCFCSITVYLIPDTMGKSLNFSEPLFSRKCEFYRLMTKSAQFPSLARAWALSRGVVQPRAERWALTPLAVDRAACDSLGLVSLPENRPGRACGRAAEPS